MFFPLSKVIFFLITPSNLLILVALVGGLLSFTDAGRGIGKWLAVGGAGTLLFVALSPAQAWLMLPLEQRFPAFAEDGAPITGIIALGGGIETGITLERGQFSIKEAGERVIALADLARRYPQARPVFVGGGGGFYDGGIAEAEAVSRHAEMLGLPRDRLILEDRSRDTHENALYAAELLKPKPGERWLLVTSAWHMPRAIGCFRKAGFEVTAYPVDYRTGGLHDAMRLHSYASDGLVDVDLATKEWVGLVAYKLAGYTDAWLPGP